MPGVFLVGFMGSGKSTVAERLAAELAIPCVDLDAMVEERVGCSVAEIFARWGESRFRQEENRALAELCAAPQPRVVALGGGTFCAARNRRLIREAGGLSVYLALPWEAISTRLGGRDTGRPLFRDRDEARRLYDEREPLYRKADLWCELEGTEAPHEVARRVRHRIEEHVACGT